MERISRKKIIDGMFGTSTQQFIKEEGEKIKNYLLKIWVHEFPLRDNENP